MKKWTGKASSLFKDSITLSGPQHSFDGKIQLDHRWLFQSLSSLPFQWMQIDFGNVIRVTIIIPRMNKMITLVFFSNRVSVPCQWSNVSTLIPRG